MSSPQRTHAIQAPKGTRDYYPADMLRRRFIEKAWRDVSVRHGFEEIDGPTFEHTDLYTVKSGEGIVSEIFGTFSGKDEEQVKAAGAGQAPYALRPEFTPTLARMYAAKAAQLPKPAKWFMAGPFFRAERPQRGRLREFLQWNVDLLGGEDTPEAKAAADAEAISCMVGLLEGLGLTDSDVRIRISDRNVAAGLLHAAGLPEDRRDEGFALLDRRAKLPGEKFGSESAAIGLDVGKFDSLVASVQREFTAGGPAATFDNPGLTALRNVWQTLQAIGIASWCDVDFGIVRGLAYYTGMVFEVIAGGERAVAGGGRYDNLIELFGGPPTPAVGFGMGDVVLSLVLQDRGLMPEGKALLDRLSEPGASYRPDVFVIANDQPESIAQLKPLVASLRRTGFHARHSYKATKNIGKLFKEASDAGARFAAVIESATEVTLKDLDKGTQDRIAFSELAAGITSRR